MIKKESKSQVSHTVYGMLVVYIQWKILFSVCIDSYESYNLPEEPTRIRTFQKRRKDHQFDQDHLLISKTTRKEAKKISLAWLGRGWMERLWLDERKPAWMIYSLWYLQLVVVAVFDDTSLWYKIPTINNDDDYPYYFLWGRSLVQEYPTSFETIIHYNPTPLFFDVFSFHFSICTSNFSSFFLQH